MAQLYGRRLLWVRYFQIIGLANVLPFGRRANLRLRLHSVSYVISYVCMLCVALSSFFCWKLCFYSVCSVTYVQFRTPSVYVPI